jgi:uncharacterized protein
MEDLRFDWDHRKARLNLRKHGIAFDEAQTAFFDQEALVLGDPEHSQTEDRFLLLGMSASLRVLAVCHCIREAGSLIRIIGARRAVRAEQNQYWERLRR